MSQWCALCGAEYVEGVAECVDCVVPLEENPPLIPDAIGDTEGDKLAYDMADLTPPDRLAVHRDLQAAGILHTFVDEGETLLVSPDDEAAADRVLGEDNDIDDPGFDPDVDDEDGDQIAYDLSDWHHARRDELSGRLLQEGIVHGFDEQGELVVRADDEERVDAILDAVEFPDQIPPDDGVDPAGAATIESVHELFVAADRLTHDPEGSQAVLAAVDAVDAIDGTTAPFGIGPPVWKDVVERGVTLRELLTADRAVLDDEVVEAAQAVRTALRPLV